ncbi:MAG TPA: hypothetical protein VL651_01200 [Bacteroidia bacterium]|jgi:hypothetical protein|nr:hypothetical protein [Bacteroidia bacterium]
MNPKNTDIKALADSQEVLPKIFSAKAARLVTVLGGPLGAGYIFAHNYNVFGEKRKAKISFIIGLLSTVLILIIANNLPFAHKNSGIIFSVINGWLAYALMNYLQGKRINTFTERGGNFYDGWRIAGISTVSCILLLSVVFAYFYLANNVFGSPSKAYGSIGNRIYYNGAELRESEVDKIAKALEDVGMFGNEKRVAVYAEKENGLYYLTFTLKNGAEEDEAKINNFKFIRNEIQNEFPSNHIVLKLSSEGGFDDVKTTLH